MSAIRESSGWASRTVSTAPAECPNCGRLEPGEVATCPACGRAMFDDGGAWSGPAGSTENPGVGGSIPSLPTILSAGLHVAEGGARRQPCPFHARREPLWDHSRALQRSIAVRSPTARSSVRRIRSSGGETLYRDLNPGQPAGTIQSIEEGPPGIAGLPSPPQKRASRPRERCWLLEDCYDGRDKTKS